MNTIARRTPRLSLALLIIMGLALLATAGPPTRAVADCAGPLHPKSAVGKMPPACGLEPDAPAPATLASLVDFLGPAINKRVGSWAQLVTAADLDNTPGDEAAVGTSDNFDPANDWQIHLFQQVNSAFNRIQQRPAQKYAEAIVAFDANHDGLMDLAVAGETGVLLMTQANGGTSPLNEPLEILTGVPVDALAVGDVNGDLRADLLAIAPEADTILAWTSSPIGLDAYKLDLDYPTDGYSALAVGDLNNDGFDDLAALRGSGYATDSVVIFLQDNGTFPVSFKLTPQTGGFLPHSLAIGDVTGDGLDDLVVTAGGNTPSAYLNVFPQAVTDATTIPPTSSLAVHPVVYDAYHLPGAVQIGDLNHDGRDDVAVANAAWRNIGVYTQADTGTLNPYDVAQIPYSSYYRPNALTLGDFDGNGGLDVAIVGRDPGLTVLPNTDAAPEATIITPPDATVIQPGNLVVTGTTTAGTTAVEVRVKGLTNWQPATLTGTTWESTITGIPSIGRSWWVEARAIAGSRYQSPPARHRVRVIGRVTNGIVALYTFEEGNGSVVKDVSGFDVPLDLDIANSAAVKWEAGRLVVTKPTIISSPGAGTKVFTNLQQANELTVEAWIIPANTTQDGPARIVTLSHTSYDVNFSLAQGLWGNQPSGLYSMRVNATQAPHNAANPLTTPNGSLTTALTHVLVTRDTTGMTRVYLDGVEVASEVLAGDFSHWDPQYPLALANEVKVPRPWLGTFDLVAIYRRALTPAEVWQNFQAGATTTPLVADPAKPAVNELTINNRDTNTDSRQVTLKVTATGATPTRPVRSVLFTEYIFNPETSAWIEVQQSDWKSYSDNPQSYPWKLEESAGVHYLHVWVRDDQNTISRFPAAAFINYVPTKDTLAEGQTRVYRYPLSAGEQFTVQVNPLSGDPDLTVWAPSDVAPLPAWVSNLREQPDVVTFAAPVNGVYQVEVTGYTASSYGLTVTTASVVRGVGPASTTGGLDVDKTVRDNPIVSLDSTPPFEEPENPVPPDQSATNRLFLPLVIR